MSLARHSLFASDLHLDSEAPWAIDAFLAFLDGPARQADALYLLGDLFEVWVGDDDDNPDNARACAGLARLSASGVAVYVLHGNRDFLLGEAFAKRTGVKLLPDPVLLDLYGVPDAAQSWRRVLHRGSCVPGIAQHRAPARLAATLSVIATPGSPDSRERRARRQQGAYAANHSRPSWT